MYEGQSSFYILKKLPGEINPLTTESDKFLIAPNGVTLESNIKEMIAGSRSS